MTMLIRCAGVCWWCDRPLGGTGVRHHRMRRRDGGDRLANLLLLHPWCHNVSSGSVHQEPRAAKERGFIVPSWADPLTYPVAVRDQWYVLSDEGLMMIASAPI